MRAPQQKRVTRARPARRAGTQSATQTQAPSSPAASQGGERGTGPVTGYVATQSVTGTKTDTPILETPQSISVVTRDQMVAQQTQDIGEALRYTPGVSLDLYSATTFFDAVKLRGFDAPRYLDGLRLPLDPGTQFAYPRIEPYGLERLEVLRGPSSGLYGQTRAGRPDQHGQQAAAAGTPHYSSRGHVRLVRSLSGRVRRRRTDRQESASFSIASSASAA